MADGPKVSYTVNYQQETHDLGPDGKPAAGYRIGFTTSKGNVGSVFVPRSRYGPDNVRAAIAAHAHELDTVSGLTGN